MFRNAEPQEAAVAPCDCCKTVPVSHLSLDLPEPVAGWDRVLAERGVEVVEDDLGRPAIRREDARALMEERREWELAHAEEARRRQEETARKSRPVSPGIPLPKAGDPSMSAYEVMRAADADAERSDPRRRLSPQEEFLTQRLGPPRKVEEG